MKFMPQLVKGFLISGFLCSASVTSHITFAAQNNSNSYNQHEKQPLDERINTYLFLVGQYSDSEEFAEIKKKTEELYRLLIPELMKVDSHDANVIIEELLGFYILAAGEGHMDLHDLNDYVEFLVEKEAYRGLKWLARLEAAKPKIEKYIGKIVNNLSSEQFDKIKKLIKHELLKQHTRVGDYPFTAFMIKGFVEGDFSFEELEHAFDRLEDQHQFHEWKDLPEDRHSYPWFESSNSILGELFLDFMSKFVDADKKERFQKALVLYVGLVKNTDKIKVKMEGNEFPLNTAVENLIKTATNSDEINNEQKKEMLSKLEWFLSLLGDK